MKLWLLSASALAGSMAITTGAFAQTTENSTTPPVGPSDQVVAQSEADTGEGQSIVVTGSRIRRPNIESNAPRHVDFRC